MENNVRILYEEIKSKDEFVLFFLSDSFFIYKYAIIFVFSLKNLIKLIFIRV